MSRRLILGDGDVGAIKHLIISDKSYVRTNDGWVELSHQVPCLEENKIDEEEEWKKIVEERRKKMWKRYSRRRK